MPIYAALLSSSFTATSSLFRVGLLRAEANRTYHTF